MSRVLVKGLYKSFGNVPAVSDVSFTVDPGQICVLLGPSGCGKTTTLRCIAGLEKPDRGEIIIGDQKVNSQSLFVAPEKRRLGMVFQSYAIWPHMTVFDNVAYGLKATGSLPKHKVREKVLDALRLVQLDHLSDRSATALSGGQQQRVALARSLAYDPAVLLLDEPLSNLDAKLREDMRFELVRLQRQLGMTMVYVTHDQDEAMILGDNIALMRSGSIIQWGTPEELYGRPKTRFVASFFGKSNLLDGQLLEVNGGTHLGLVRISDEDTVRCRVGDLLKPGDPVSIAVRPESLRIIAPDATIDDRSNRLTARVLAAAFVGDRYEISLGLASIGKDLRAYEDYSRRRRQTDEQVCVTFEASDCLAVLRDE